MANTGTNDINTRLIQPFATSFTIPRTNPNTIKVLDNITSPIIDSTKDRKHRFTIFIGYGDEAGNLLKRCEQLKCKLGLSTNMQFLTFLLEYYDRHNNGYRIDTETLRKEAYKKPPDSNISSYVYDAKLKTFNTIVTQQPTTTMQNLSNITNLNYDPSLSNISNVVTATTPQCNNKIINGQQHSSEVALKQQLELITLQNQINTNIISITGGTNIIPHQTQNNSTPMLQNNIDLPSCTVNFDNNVFNPLALTTTNTKPHENISTDYIDSNTKQEPGIVPEPPAEGMNEAIKPIDVDLPLPISSLNMKALKVIHHYMENIKNNLCYYHGYIASSEKLKSFLRDYRKATYTVFTVRSSRSYVKKRALNALKSIRDNESVDFNICDDREGGGDIVPPLPDDVTNFNQQNENLMNTMNCGDMPATTTASMKTRRGRTRKRDDDSLNDVHQGVVGGSGMDDDGNMLTGPLRWEFILGKPPIPFTGVPFFIIGNTQYQCYYATADIRTQRRKEKIAKILKENPTVKARVRRSMKRDCKAVMCIKSIVTFPEFSVVEQIQNIKSKKGARKVKATTLDNLRDVLEKGGNCGHPAFWVHIPLPEAHTTHDIVGTDHKVSDNGNNLDEIAHILELAAQYGNHLDSRHIENAPIPAVSAGHMNEGHMAGNSSRQLDMTSEQNATAHHLVPFKLNDPAKELETNQTLALPNDFLCVGNNSTISSTSHIIA